MDKTILVSTATVSRSNIFLICPTLTPTHTQALPTLDFPSDHAIISAAISFHEPSLCNSQQGEESSRVGGGALALKGDAVDVDIESGTAGRNGATLRQIRSQVT